MPTFLFQINEIREHQNVDPISDSNGYWIPSDNPGFNIIARDEGVTGVWWMCNGDRIWSLSDRELPPNKQHYKTFSVFYCDGLGFRVLHGNASNPTAGEVWRPLGFEHDREDGYASFLTNAMQNPTLCRHRNNQAWPRMLLPDIYHGPVSTNAARGALKGELPIFLALLALSMDPNQILTCLPLMLQGGAWQVHGMNGRTHKRGVMVSVYSCPTWVGATAADIEGLEEGRHGQKYYY